MTQHLTVEIQRLPHAEGLALPAYQTAHAAGLDLLAAVPGDKPLVMQPGQRAPQFTRGQTLLDEAWELTRGLDFDPALIERLRAAGHPVEMLPDFTSTMGHAGAIVRGPDGLMAGASDPRSDGAVAAF